MDLFLLIETDETISTYLKFKINYKKNKNATYISGEKLNHYGKRII